MRHGAALYEEFGFDSCFAIPTNLYGPGESFDPARSHVVGALVRRFVEAETAAVPKVTCWGTGGATRDLLYATDAARFLVRLLAVGGGTEPINLGSGAERTIKEIATTIAQAAGYRGEVAWDAEKPDGMPRKVLDLQLAESRLGRLKQTPFADGIRETVECFRSLS
jgi:GDP-L-fucose synthase